MSASPLASMAPKTPATAKAEEPEAAKEGEYGRSKDAQEEGREGNDYDSEEDAKQEEYFRNKASTKPVSEVNSNETPVRLDEISKRKSAVYKENEQAILEREEAKDEGEEKDHDSEDTRQEEYNRKKTSAQPLSEAKLEQTLARLAEAEKSVPGAHGKGKQRALRREDAEKEEEEEYQSDIDDDLDNSDDSEDIRQEEYIRNEASFPELTLQEVDDLLRRAAEIKRQVFAAHKKTSSEPGASSPRLTRRAS